MHEKIRFNLLDTYRGLAALLVVTYHITIEMYDKFHFVVLGNIFRQGNIGVDFFFVLSGFIIFYIHDNDAGSVHRIIGFFKKRAIRIFPSYWLIVTIILATVLFLQSHIVNKPPLSGNYLLATYTLFPHAYRLIPASWTLTEELYFYLLFGILMFVRPVRLRLILFFLIGIVLTIGSFFITHSLQPIAEEFITPYVIEFVGGCFAGYVFKYLTSYVSKSVFILLTIVSISLYAVTMMPLLFQIRVFLITLSFGLFVWSTASYESTYKPRINRVLLLIGQSSYVIYLAHAFIVQILFKALYDIHVPTAPLILSLIVLGSFLICAFLPTLLYTYYERPVLKLLRRKLL
jgi:exopolysaccharide production protein ExoZ